MFRPLLSIVLLYVSMATFATSVEKSEKCGKWLASAVKDIESVPADQRFQRGLKQIKTGCEQVIPKILKQAAADAIIEKNPDKRFEIMIKAVKPFYGESCFYIPVGQSAEQLIHLCKGDDYPDGPFSGSLPFIDAASYLYGKAVQAELRKNLQMKDASNKDFLIKKFMLNYFLGAQLEYEKQKNKAIS